MADLARKVGRRIRELRRARGLTQATLAERLDISENYRGGLERGNRFPSLQLLETLADAFGVPVFELFRFPEEMLLLPSQKKRVREYNEATYTLEGIIRERSAEEIELMRLSHCYRVIPDPFLAEWRMWVVWLRPSAWASRSMSWTNRPQESGGRRSIETGSQSHA